jgi:hypothetical protein
MIALFNAVVAQLVERLLAMQKVVSSNLISRSKFYQTFLFDYKTSHPFVMN